ncbi:MAG: AAA family ATPase [Candidatus Scalindua sp.]|jgi:predicted ATP-dependent endonuclease of OLD family|nr:AAA family ATPase [Candidatus Scalindua sp.]MBT6045401.1 AAA family ATPase [Candidatus Scalindua sp.]MBT6231074.1 AAA family ATPase [Candidatus Scalindua sp.]MBT6564464.1 AAA family ATPase [Candidatus Scalindua sp.]
MRLIKYKVNKFRSVKCTDWIDIDQWACFVGVNESGKTNLLLPLWKFNPADEATKIDLLHDYPRDEYSELTGENTRENEHFIETLFELNDSDIKVFESYYAESQENAAKVEGENSEEKAVTSTRKKKKYGFKQYLLIKKDYKERFYIYISNEGGEDISKDIDDDVGEDVFKKVCETIPRFVYYSEYGNLDSDLYLPHVKDNLGRIDQLVGKERMKARTLKILFGHLKLNVDEILELGQEHTPNNNPSEKANAQITKESRMKQERFAKVNSAASRLTTQFREWWTQGHYIFNFNADGEYFRIFVSDTERPVQIELESRSRGLQWFFSFFLVFLAESEDNHKNCILLLDEPGLSLHPNAQTDLIRFFNQVSEKNQLIYTTHLPFLVDHHNLDKVKAVYTESGLTQISNDLSKADKEKKSIQPVNAAIGISAAQSLLVGCDIVIVEGVSDQFYLTMIKNHLVSKGKFKPAREMVFIPVGGAKGVKPVVSIIQGAQSDLPFTLLDSDTTGKQFQTSLKNGFYSDNKDKVIETDTFTDKTGSEIEDLIPLDLLVDCFDRVFRTEDGLSKNDIDGSKPIIPQLENFSEENRLGLKDRLGWKVELSKKVKQKFKSEVTGDMEEKWIELFNTIQT